MCINNALYTIYAHTNAQSLCCTCSFRPFLVSNKLGSVVLWAVVAHDKYLKFITHVKQYSALYYLT